MAMLIQLIIRTKICRPLDQVWIVSWNGSGAIGHSPGRLSNGNGPGDGQGSGVPEACMW